MLGNSNNRANRKLEQEKYDLMSRSEKVEYLIDKVSEELKNLNIDTTCMASRETCIDCALQEILNLSKGDINGV